MNNATKKGPDMLKNMENEPPPNGSKFVVLFSDGSGASLYMRDDEGFYLQAEDGCSEVIDPGHFWLPVPDYFKFWFENYPDD